MYRQSLQAELESVKANVVRLDNSLNASSKSLQDRNNQQEDAQTKLDHLQTQRDQAETARYVLKPLSVCS